MPVVFLFIVGLVAVGASVAEESAISPPASVPADRSFRGSSAGTGLAEPTKVTDLSTVVSLQAFNQGGAWQPQDTFSQKPGYPQGGYQQGGAQQAGPGAAGFQPSRGHEQFSMLLAVLIPLVAIVCVCCCIIHFLRCCCGDLFGGDMSPMAGAGLGAVAGYEMAQYADGQGGYGYGGYGGGFDGKPMY